MKVRRQQWRRAEPAPWSAAASCQLLHTVGRLLLTRFRLQGTDDQDVLSLRQLVPSAAGVLPLCGFCRALCLA